MTEQRENQFFKGALLLTVAGTLSKILSAGYRIPLQNLTGDIYQQIYPLLGTMMILSLYGFPSAISKLMAESRSSGKEVSLVNFYLPILSILILINGLFFVILWNFSDSFASFAGDIHLSMAYRYTAIAFLLIPFTSLLRGAFQGHQKMTPTAVSQIGKQLIRVFIIIYVAYAYSIGKMGAYEIGEFGAIALIAGSAFALLILIFYFLKEKPYQRTPIEEIPWSYFWRSIVIVGIVAVFNHMILLLIQLVDVFTLIPHLTMHGYEKNEAMILKGIFDRGQPLIQLGAVLGSSFALALLPNVSAHRVVGKNQELESSIHEALSVTLYIAIAATVGLILIFPETNTLLYENTKGTGSLQILSLAILLSALTITIATILQGLNDYKRTALYIFFAFMMKWLLNGILIPHFSIRGSALATVFSLLFLSFLLTVRLKKVFPDLRLFQVFRWRALGGALLGMVTIVQFFRLLLPYELLPSRLFLLLYVLFMITIGATVYFYLLYRLQAFKNVQSLQIRLANLFKRRF